MSESNRQWLKDGALALVVLVVILGAIEVGRRIVEPQTPVAMHAEAPRSGKWRAFEKACIAKHPYCAVCGATKGLQLHHVKAFRDHPDLELSEANVIVLCGPEAHNCHFTIGHLFSFLVNNPHVREDAALLAKHFEEARR